MGGGCDTALSGFSYTTLTWRKTGWEIKKPASLQALWILVPLVGFELTTYRLQGGHNRLFPALITCKKNQYTSVKQ